MGHCTAEVLKSGLIVHQCAHLKQFQKRMLHLNNQRHPTGATSRLLDLVRTALILAAIGPWQPSVHQLQRFVLSSRRRNAQPFVSILSSAAADGREHVRTHENVAGGIQWTISRGSSSFADACRG